MELERLKSGEPHIAVSGNSPALLDPFCLICVWYVCVYVCVCIRHEYVNMEGTRQITTGMTRKMSQRYFCPAEYTTKPKPKANPKTNPNPNPNPNAKLSCFFF